MTIRSKPSFSKSLLVTVEGVFEKALNKSWRAAHKCFTRIRDSDKLPLALTALYFTMPVADAWTGQDADHGDHQSPHSNTAHLGDLHFPVLGVTHASDSAVNLSIELWPGQKCYFDSFPKELLGKAGGNYEPVTVDASSPVAPALSGIKPLAAVKGAWSDLRQKASGLLTHREMCSRDPYPVLVGTHRPLLEYTEKNSSNMSLGINPWLHEDLGRGRSGAEKIPEITICGDITPETRELAKNSYLFWKFDLSPALQAYLSDVDIYAGETISADQSFSSAGNRASGSYRWGENRISMPAWAYTGEDPAGKSALIHGVPNATDWNLLDEGTVEFNLMHEIGHAICDHSGIFNLSTSEGPLADAFNEDYAKLKPSQIKLVDEYYRTPCELGAQIIATLLCPEYRPEGILQILFPKTTALLIETINDITGGSQNLHIYQRTDFPNYSDPDPTASSYYGMPEWTPDGKILGPIEEYPVHETITVTDGAVMGKNSTFVGPLYISEGTLVGSGLALYGNSTAGGIKTAENDVFVSDDIAPVGRCIEVSAKELAPNRVYICKSDGVRTEFWLPVKPYDQSNAVYAVERQHNRYWKPPSERHGSPKRPLNRDFAVAVELTA